MQRWEYNCSSNRNTSPKKARRISDRIGKTTNSGNTEKRDSATFTGVILSDGKWTVSGKIFFRAR